MKRRLSNFLGFTLLVASLFYLYQNLSGTRKFLSDLGSLFDSPFTFLLCFSLYLIALLFQAFCWALLSKRGALIDFKASFVFQSKTQIYRYLPTGTLHYLARQQFARKNGIKQKLMASLSLGELLLQILVALSISLVFIVFAVTLIDISLVNHFTIIMAVTFSTVMVVLLFSYFIKRKLIRFGQFFESLMLGNSVKAVVSTVIYFLLNGVVLVLIAQLFIGQTIGFSLLVCLISGYSLAWLVGLLAPLSPAGLGVREAALVSLMLLLSISSADLIAITHRLIQLFTDAVYAMAFYFIRSDYERGVS